MSTATSNISPSTARTSLACGRRLWACNPRSALRQENEWLSCTNGPAMPAAAYLPSWYDSRKKPRSSRNTSGSMISTPGSSLGSTFIVGASSSPVLGPLFDQRLQVAAVLVAGHGLGDLQHVGRGDVAHDVGHLLRAGHLQPLALLDGLDERGGLQQRLVRAGVEPGHAA